MQFEEEINKIINREAFLLGEISISTEDYAELIKQAFNKHVSPYSGEKYNILQALALTQIAIRCYDGDYLGHLKLITSQNIKKLEDLFLNVCQQYNLFQNKRGVELIKAHAYVTPHDVNEYFDFVNSLYCDEFHHGIPEDLPDELTMLQQDIKELGNAQKSRYLPKSTQAVFSCISPDVWSRIIMPHLQMFDDFWRGKGVSSCSFCPKEFSEWLNIKYPSGASDSTRKRKGSSSFQRGRKPYFKITANDDIILVIPEQRFTACDENTALTMIIQSGHDQWEDQLYMCSSGRGKGKSFYYSKEKEITQLKGGKIKLFQKYTLIIKSHPKNKIFEIDEKDYYFFAAFNDNTLIEKNMRPLASGCIVVRKGSKLSSSGRIDALSSEISGAELYSISLKENDTISINGKNINIATPYSVKYENFAHCIFYHLDNKPIEATRVHPIITLSLDKNSYDTAQLLIHKQPLRLSTCKAVLKKEYEEHYEIKIDISKLDNMVAQGLYEIKLESTTKDEKKELLKLRYLYLPDFYCKISLDNQFIDKPSTYMTFPKTFELTGNAQTQLVTANNKKQQKYKIDLRQDANQVEYSFTLDDNLYSLAIHLNRLLICTDGVHFRYHPECELWHEEIFARLGIIIPHAQNACLYLKHKPESRTWGTFKSRKRIFEFDVDNIRCEIRDYDKPKVTLVLKYETNDGKKRDQEYSVLRNVWFDYFKLLAKDGQVFIRTEFKGKESCKLEFYDAKTDILITKQEKLCTGDTILPALSPDALYDIHQIQPDDSRHILRRVAAIDPSDLTNCRITLNTINIDGEEKKLTQQYYYSLQNLKKISNDRYSAKLFRGTELLHDHVQIVLEDFREQRMSLECFSEYEGSSYIAPLYYDYENYALIESCKDGYHLHGNNKTTTFGITVRRIYQHLTIH